jgi:hypothetical protein
MAKIDYVPTGKVLLEIDKAMELKNKLEKSRNYLGASAIGEPCWRKLFYSFRGACKREISAKGLRAIEDGFLQEKVMADRLRMIPSVELYTDDGDGNQIGFEMLGGFLRGHIDGMLLNPFDGSKTEFEIWEHKSVNIEKFNKLVGLIEKLGEKSALAEWDELYHSQGILYMDAFNKKRHTLTVTTPGGRDYTMCRTEASVTKANMLKDKAQVIIFENFSIPPKISEKREFYLCNFCDYKGICHDCDIPDVSCKTCRYRDADMQTGKFKCLATDTIIEDTLLNVGCAKHIFNPTLISGVKLLEHQSDGCLYQVEGKDYVFANTNLTGFPDVKGKIDGIFTSKQLREDIKNIHDITNTVLNAFKGTMIEPEKAKKAWDVSNKWEI